MEEKKKCLCSSSDVRVVACSGAPNAGQISNQAALELAKANVAEFFCLAGVGAHIKGMVKSAKGADLMVAIDGCPVQCAAKTLQHAEIEPGIQIIITELGIEKSHDIVLDEKACSMVIEKVKEEMGLAYPIGDEQGMVPQNQFEVKCRRCANSRPLSISPSEPLKFARTLREGDICVTGELMTKAK